MFLDPYDYELDLEVQKEEAFEDGMEKGKDIGFTDGANKKAIEGAMILIRDFNVSPEIAAQKMNAPLDKVLELAETIKK